MHGNPKFIFVLNKKIYFMEGLAHLSGNRGEIFLLDTTNQKFTFTGVLDLMDAPEEFNILHNKIYLIGSRNFYVIEDFIVTEKIERKYWDGVVFHATSLFNKRMFHLSPACKMLKLMMVGKRAVFYNT
jgi:hypothetical protein